MGALHQGHLSLVRRARGECDCVVVSIFVNPIQFGPKEDYADYPRTFEKDCFLLNREKTDIVFHPKTSAVFSSNHSTYVTENSLSQHLCGLSRPGHFTGVCTIVAKLFNIVMPDVAYFGRKDYQQALIIQKMVDDLNFPVKIKTLPIVREKDGLAMSSRNKYLTAGQRKQALCLRKALLEAAFSIKRGRRKSSEIINQIQKALKGRPQTKVDYVEIVEARSLKPLKKLKGRVLIALAVYVGKTRLIDNVVIDVK